MTLGELIAFLRAHDPAIVVPVGFADPHSYRGDYAQLAFEPAEHVTVGSMLACATDALGCTFTGYKGGEFEMHAWTTVNLARRGETGEAIGPILLGYMVGQFRGGTL